MGCRLSDFKLSGPKQSETLTNGMVLESQKAQSETLSGVAFWVNGKFRGFTGTHNGARANVLEDSDHYRT